MEEIKLRLNIDTISTKQHIDMYDFPMGFNACEPELSSSQDYNFNVPDFMSDGGFSM